MARPRRCILALDMGMHSPLHQRLSNHLYAQQTRLNGPVAARTRSRTRSPPRLPTPTPPVESGTITERRISPNTLDRAERKLRHKRLKLKKQLETNEKHRDEDGYLKRSVHSRIQQLSYLSPTGALGHVPTPRPVTWQSDSKMQHHRRKFTSSLCNVERMWSEKELDDLFGLLSSEERFEGGSDWNVEWDVEKMLTEEGKVIEGMCEGNSFGGVWMHLEVHCEDEEMGLVRMWIAKDVVVRRQVGDGEVMDTRGVYVARNVWKAVGVDVAHW
jgi:hypothetical protein